MKVVVAGYMIRYPLAGMMLAFFHYVLGLKRLGHEVVYLEESGWPQACYDPLTERYSDDPSVGIRAVTGLAAKFGATLPICYVDRLTGQVTGLSRHALRSHLASADLLLNIGGTCSLEEFDRCGRRALIDMDPLFTQAGRFAGDDLYDYHVHFSYGANIGCPDCSVPEAGISWQPTVPPVVPDIWAQWADTVSEQAPLTTVCNWGAYGGIEHGGEHYGQKDEEFIRLLDVPGRSPETIELAIAGADEGTRRMLREAGWRLRSASEVTADFESYAGYIGGSRGEFSAAKNAYVKTWSGWFSDRSVCYLAAGRPVILQDTGASRWLPESPSVLFFSTPGQAVEQLESLHINYAMRCHSARELAADCFGHQVVLPRLLDRACSESPSAGAGSRTTMRGE